MSSWAGRIKNALQGEVDGSDALARLAAGAPLAGLRQQLADRRLEAEITNTGEEWRVPDALAPVAAPLWLAESLVSLAQSLCDAEAAAHRDRPSAMAPLTHGQVIALLDRVPAIAADISAGLADPGRRSGLSLPILAPPYAPGGAGLMAERIPLPYLRGLLDGVVGLSGSVSLLVEDYARLLSGPTTPPWLGGGLGVLRGNLAAAQTNLDAAQGRATSLLHQQSSDEAALRGLAIDLWQLVNTYLKLGQMIAAPGLLPGAQPLPPRARPAPSMPQAAASPMPQAPAPNPQPAPPIAQGPPPPAAPWSPTQAPMAPPPAPPASMPPAPVASIPPQWTAPPPAQAVPPAAQWSPPVQPPPVTAPSTPSPAPGAPPSAQTAPPAPPVQPAPSAPPASPFRPPVPPVAPPVPAAQWTPPARPAPVPPAASPRPAPIEAHPPAASPFSPAQPPAGAGRKVERNDRWLLASRPARHRLRAAGQEDQAERDLAAFWDARGWMLTPQEARYLDDLASLLASGAAAPSGRSLAQCPFATIFRVAGGAVQLLGQTLRPGSFFSYEYQPGGRGLVTDLPPQAGVADTA